MSALLQDDEAALRQRVAELATEFPSAGPLARLCVEWIAREDLRLRRLRAEQEGYRALLARRAALAWADDRALEAEELFARLARRPAKIRRALERTKHGCAALLLRWHGLERIWALKGEWSEAQQALALDLLGTPRELRDGAELPTPAQIRQEIERLERRQADELDHLDRAEQALAEAGSGPPDATLKGLIREEAAALRRIQWAQDQLRRPPATVQEPAPPVEAGSPVESPEPVASRSGVSYVAVAASRRPSAVATDLTRRKVAS